MSSKHLCGDTNYAWPTAEIAVMGAKVRHPGFPFCIWEMLERGQGSRELGSRPWQACLLPSLQACATVSVPGWEEPRVGFETSVKGRGLSQLSWPSEDWTFPLAPSC